MQREPTKQEAMWDLKYGINVDQIRSLYVDNHLSSNEIVKSVGCSVQYLLRFMKRSGIPIRSKSEGSKIMAEKTYQKIFDYERNQIIDLYVNQLKSSLDICAQLNLSKKSVLDVLRTAGVVRSGSASIKLSFKTKPECRERSKRNAMLMAQRGYKSKDTKPELDFKAWADRNNIYFIHQYEIDGLAHKYDFYLPIYNLIVEVDGDYWHSIPEQLKKDREFEKFAIGHGHKLIRFLQSTIDNSKLSCFDIIKTFDNSIINW